MAMMGVSSWFRKDVDWGVPNLHGGLTCAQTGGRGRHVRQYFEEAS